MQHFLVIYDMFNCIKQVAENSFFLKFRESTLQPTPALLEAHYK
jgi:hypothetical protein